MLNILALSDGLRVGQLPAAALLLLGAPRARAAILDAEQLAVRVALWLSLAPFEEQESGNYIRHRLETADGSSDLFEPEAVKAVWQHAQGVPLRTNRVCDLALLAAFGEDRRSVSSDDVDYAVCELNL